jgi:3-hydroxyacyl-[acyl-carrier-protein] dehydratase
MRTLNSLELQRFQPNRYPFLLIDRVTDFEPGVYANGFKNFTNNEWFFPVHFPGSPNVPGALQLEAMAQMLTIALTTLEGLEGSVTHALRHTVRFRKEVVPGDKLEIHSKVLSWSRGVCTGYATSSVDGDVVSEAEMTITIPEILKSYLPK